MEVVDIYCRVSTTEQAQEGYSLEAQEEKLRKYAEAHSWTINAVLVDGGYSGASMDRPALTKVIDDAKNHRINKVLVYKLDRLSRSQKDTLYIIEDILLRNKVDFVSMTETLDTSTPFGLAMIGILSVFAQLERETIKERMMMGRDASVKSGKYHGSGGFIPIGFRKDGTKLIPDEYEQMIVKEVFRRYNSGESMHQIMNELEREHPIRNAKWSRARISLILDNPMYIGMQKWKKKVVPTDDIIPIIDEATWNETRRLREIRSKLYEQYQTSNKHVSLLGGIIFCGECGKRMRYNRVKGNKLYYYYEDDYSDDYQQAGYTKKLTHRYSMEYIDDLVIDEIRKLSSNRTMISDMEKENKLNQTRRDQIQKRIESLKAQQSRLIDLYASGMIDQSLIKEKADKITTELETLTNDLNAITITDNSRTEEINKNIDTFDQLISTTTDKMELYNVVRALIRTVTVYKDHIQLSWNF